jgi:hypothetical protein
VCEAGLQSCGRVEGRRRVQVVALGGLGMKNKEKEKEKKEGPTIGAFAKAGGVAANSTGLRRIEEDDFSEKLGKKEADANGLKK